MGPGSTSRSWLARLRHHEADAWDRLMRLYAPLVLHWCRRSGLRDQDGADVVQEVFRAVAAHVATFAHDRPGGTFRGWLRTITRHRLTDLHRRRQRQADAAGGTDADDPEEVQAERDLVCRALEAIRGDFTQRTWSAFWRTAVDGQDPAAVAADLGLSAGALRVARCRVLRRLREELGDGPAA
jgi:RNA polymerase sigma-70 factor (ECF subfamily)